MTSGTRTLSKIVSGIQGHLEILKEEGIAELEFPVLEAEPKGTEMPKAKAAVKTPKLNVGEKKEALIALRKKIVGCTKCGELAAGRTQIVFGSGNANAKLMFVGEAPGREEDEHGFPFVGRSGKLLTKIIESIGLTREKVFIVNVLKCRPPQNRNPQPDEIKNCEPFLLRQLEIIQPKVICTLGTFAAQTLLKTELPISGMRGKFHDYHGVKLLPTFHPAYLLRNPSAKKTVWEDMKKIRKELLNK